MKLGEVGGTVANWGMAIGAGVGAVGGLVYRNVMSVEPVCRFVNSSGIIKCNGAEATNSALGGFCNVSAPYKNGLLNFFNTGMQTFATAQNLGLSKGFRDAALLGRDFTGIGAVGLAYKYCTDNGKPENRSESRMLALTAAGAICIGASTAYIQKNYLRNLGDPSGHVMMMTAYGVSAGLVCRMMHINNCNKGVQAFAGVVSLVAGLANVAFLANTASCWHTVDEVANGAIWAAGVTAASIGIATAGTALWNKLRPIK